ncbi:MAG: hypothetical protein Q9197_005561 [Variospora fuerteventurae]
MVIATIKSEVVRGTFIPSKLSKYDALSSKTTITSTKSREKPVTLVVGPGGVAWVPFPPSQPPKPLGHHETGSKDQDQSTKGSGFASGHPPGTRVPDKSRTEQASEGSSSKTGKSPAGTKDHKSTPEATKRPVGTKHLQSKATKRPAGTKDPKSEATKRPAGTKTPKSGATKRPATGRDEPSTKRLARSGSQRPGGSAPLTRPAKTKFEPTRIPEPIHGFSRPT